MSVIRAFLERGGGERVGDDTVEEKEGAAGRSDETMGQVSSAGGQGADEPPVGPAAAGKV